MFFKIRVVQKTRRLRVVAALLGVGLAVAAFASSALPMHWMLGPFHRPADARPVITPNPQAVFEGPIRHAPVHWESLHTFNPAAVVRDGKIYVLYRAEDNTGTMEIGGHTSRIGLAESSDGVHFTRRPAPVFFPAEDSQKSREWPGGVEDPRVVERPDGTYVMTYTQWNRKIFSVGIAASKDLIHWKKYGPAFLDADGGKYAHLRYKSAGIVTHLEDGRLIAAKIQGKYWMYWGAGKVGLATSEDLIHWTPITDKSGHFLIVLSRRPGHFDSSFPEVGPPPVLTRNGIVVIYNGMNAPVGGDPALGANAYAAGQALFAANNPEKILARAAKPFFKPEMAFEKTGQYKAGTTFVEGLVYFRGKWFLYYGCADSDVGVAIADGTPQAKAR